MELILDSYQTPTRFGKYRKSYFYLDEVNNMSQNVSQKGSWDATRVGGRKRVARRQFVEFVEEERMVRVGAETGGKYDGGEKGNC